MTNSVIICTLALAVLAAILSDVTCEEEEKRRSRCDKDKNNGFKECFEDITKQELTRESFKDNSPSEENWKKIRICVSEKIGALKNGVYDHDVAITFIETTQSDPTVISELKEAITTCDTDEIEIDDKLKCHGEAFKKICWGKE